MFGPPFRQTFIFDVGFKTKHKKFYFSGKIVTCLAYIFTMQKAQVKIILERIFVDRYSIFFRHFLDFLECKG